MNTVIQLFSIQPQIFSLIAIYVVHPNFDQFDPIFYQRKPFLYTPTLANWILKLIFNLGLTSETSMLNGLPCPNC